MFAWLTIALLDRNYDQGGYGRRQLASHRIAVRNGTERRDQKSTLRVTPHVSSAPSTVTVRAYVEPNAHNRRLRVEAR